MGLPVHACEITGKSQLPFHFPCSFFDLILHCGAHTIPPSSSVCAASLDSLGRGTQCSLPQAMERTSLFDGKRTALPDTRLMGLGV